MIRLRNNSNNIAEFGICRFSGMEGAKNGFIESQMPSRADTPNQGVSCRQEPHQPPAKPDRTEPTAIQVVGGRRPSMLQRYFLLFTTLQKLNTQNHHVNCRNQLIS